MGYPRAVSFSQAELWVLQAAVRHESGEQWAGEYPAHNRGLNDQIAAALASGDNDAILLLNLADLYAIDATVSQFAKDGSGKVIGRDILLKSFRARCDDPADPESTQSAQEWLDNAGNENENQVAVEDGTGTGPLA